MQSKAKTVEEYLRELPEDRREAISAVRSVILKNLPKGFEEGMGYGMMGYYVPLSRYPAGYLGKKDTPLPYAGLASQKNYMSLYLMSVYGNKEAEEKFKRDYDASGKKLDMGKSCVRFKRLADIPLDVIGHAVARTSVEEFIALYEKSRKKNLV